MRQKWDAVGYGRRLQLLANAGIENPQRRHWANVVWEYLPEPIRTALDLVRTAEDIAELPR